MKWQRLFCFLLAFCFIFSVPFSLSAYAYTVNDYTVETYYQYVGTDASTFKSFETTITSSVEDNDFTVQCFVTFPTPIEDGTVIDLTVDLDFSTTKNIEYRATLYGSSGGGPFGTLDGTVVNGQIFVDNLSIEGSDLIQIQFQFDITNPTWNENIVEEPEEPEEQSYIGTWKLKDTLTFSDSDKILNLNGKFYYGKSGTLNVGQLSHIKISKNSITFSSILGFAPFYSTKFTTSSVTSEYQASINGTTSTSSISSSLVSQARLFTINSEPTADVKAFLDTNAVKQNDGTSLASTVYYTYNFTVTNVSYEKVEGEKLLGGILGWIKNLWNGIINLPNNIANAIKSFFDSIANGIKELGQNLLDGLVGLFVPSEDDLTGIKGRFESLLENRFGAVYDSTQIIDDFANAFNSQSQSAMIDGNGANGSISFPAVTVDLVGTPFTFGGWNVDLIPDKFEGLIDTLKIITNIVCTFLFVNGMRRRLDGVLK